MFSKKIKLSIVILISFLLAYYNGTISVYVTNLSGQYLLRSLDLFNNEFENNFERGPIYPLLVSWLHNFFGVNPYNAVLIHFKFYILNFIIVFFLAKKVFNFNTSLISILIFALSHELLSSAITIELSFVYSFFILFSLLVYILAIEKKKYFYFILSGSLIGLGFLTKEIILFYLFAPVLCFLFKTFREKIFIRGFLIYLLSFIIIITPWLILALNNNAHIEILGNFREGQAAHISFYGENNIFSYMFKSILTGFSNSIFFLKDKNEQFLFFICGVILFFKKKIILEKKRKNILFFSYMLIAVSLLGPFGLFMDGSRQIVVSIIILIVVASYFGTEIFYSFYKLIKNIKLYFFLILFFIIFSFIITNFFNFEKQFFRILIINSLLFFTIKQFISITNFKIKPRFYYCFNYYLNIILILSFIAICSRSLKYRIDTYSFSPLQIQFSGRLNSALIDLSYFIKKQNNNSICFQFKNDHSLMFLTEKKYDYVRPETFTAININDFSKNNLKDKKSEILYIKYHEKFKIDEFRYKYLTLIYKDILISYFNTIKNNKCLLVLNLDDIPIMQFIDVKPVYANGCFFVFNIKNFDNIFFNIQNFDNKKIIETFLKSDYVELLRKEYPDKFNLINELN